MASLTGVKELIATMNELGGPGVKRVTRAAVGKAQRPLVKAIKAKIPPKYKHLKQIVGSRYSKAKGGEAKGQVQAKVGFGVGMKRRVNRKGKVTLSKKFMARKDRTGGGTGISANNIHWLVLGTQPRTIKAGGKNGFPPAGMSTGTMPAVLKDVVPSGMAAGEGAAMAALTQGLRDGIAREAAKVKA